MFKRQAAVLAGFLAIVALVGAGCGQTPAPAEGTGPAAAETTETGPISIGLIVPVTGDAAAYGEPGHKIVQLAVEKINQAGGVNGRELKVILQDGKCNGTDATNAMQKLVNADKVKIVIGGFCSSESLAAAPIANANKVLLFSPGSSSPDLTTKGGPMFARNYPSDAAQGKVLAEVANTKGWKTVAVAQEQTDYALGVRRAFEENFKALGGIVVVEEFASNVTDFRTIITKIKSGTPDALFVSVQTPKVAELVLKQVKQLNWAVPLLGVDIIPGSDLPKTQPQLVEGMIVAEFGYDAESQKFKDFVAAYKAKYNEEVPFLSYAQTEYDAVMMIADAIKAVGLDGEKIRAWIGEQKDWEGVSGKVTIDANGDRAAGHRAEVIKGGKIELLTE